MLMNVECKKCGEHFKLDIKDSTKEQVIEQLSKKESFECPGHHVELSSPINYWIFGDIIPGKALTDKAWLKEQKKKGIKLYSNDQVRDLFVCESFSYGLFCGYRKKDHEKVVLDFVTSPEGHRYYY